MPDRDFDPNLTDLSPLRLPDGYTDELLVELEFAYRLRLD